MEATEAKKDAGEGAKRPARTKRVVKQIVVREFGEIGKYRVRIVRTSEKAGSPAWLDIREYVKGANFEGFTRKGVRLGTAEMKALRAVLEEAGATIE